MAVERPLKEGNVRTYQAKVSLGFPDILAAEVDADLDTIYAAWNGGIPVNSVGTLQLIDGSVGTPKLADLGVTTAKLADAPNGITTSKLNDGAVTWAQRGELSYARVFRQSSLPTIANNTVTALTFDVVGVNQGGMYSAAFPDRFTVQANGFYLFGGSVEWSPAAGGANRWLFVSVGGSNLAGEMGGANWRPMSVMTGTSLIAGNAIQLQVFQDSGAGLGIISSLFFPNFWIARVG